MWIWISCAHTKELPHLLLSPHRLKSVKYVYSEALGFTYSARLLLFTQIQFIQRLWKLHSMDICKFQNLNQELVNLQYSAHGCIWKERKGNKNIISHTCILYRVVREDMMYFTHIAMENCQILAPHPILGKEGSNTIEIVWPTKEEIIWYTLPCIYSNLYRYIQLCHFSNNSLFIGLFSPQYGLQNHRLPLVTSLWMHGVKQ